MSIKQFLLNLNLKHRKPKIYKIINRINNKKQNKINND